MVERNNMLSSKIAYRGLLLGIALILSYVEAIIPLAPGIPGMKLGLPNLVVVLLLLTDTPASAIMVNICRILLVGFMFGNMSSVLYGLAGGLLSFLIMYLLKRTERFSIIGISAAGGFFHNLGQLIIATLVLQSKAVFAYFPYLALCGIGAGIVIGIVGGLLKERTKGFFG